MASVSRLKGLCQLVSMRTDIIQITFNCQNSIVFNGLKKKKAFTGSNSYWCLSKSVENNLDKQTVVFIVAVNQDKYKKESSPML